ncbi:MAG TPA: hypothetical protein VFW94_23865 [Candidatus Acidoferrales bacterium]|nr:hypothetical protein [Candidatus Acidoferrales bacterium]
MLLDAVKIGAKVYLAKSVVGEPGFVRAISGDGRAIVEWPYEETHISEHSLSDLVPDGAFTTVSETVGRSLAAA